MIKSQTLSAQTVLKRLYRCKSLKKRFRNHKNILFTDEKLFTIEQAYNRQNTRVWSTSEKKGALTKIQRVQKPLSVMVWAGITHNGKTPLFFIKAGVKINQHNYLKFLEEKVLPWTQEHFGRTDWTFQQDSAPAHKAKKVQKWMTENFPNFIKHEEWPSSSPDLNPMDFCIWNLLQERACKKPHTSLKTLKTSLKKEWREIDLSTVKKCCKEFLKRLDLCIEAKGGHFE